MGGQTISTSETRIEALKLQSSAYGVTIPVVGGQTRIAGNLVYYTDFKAIPRTTTQSSGKGGGVKTQNTSYTYQASVIMGLCHGVVTDVLRIWRGKERFEAATLNPAVATITEQTTTPGGGGAYSYAVAQASKFSGDLGVIYKPTADSDDVRLTPGVDYEVSNGVYTFPANSAATGTYHALSITYQTYTPAATKTAMQQLGVTLVKGSLSQTPPSWLSSLHASESINYPMLAYVHAQDYQLGSGAQVENHTFEVVGMGAYGVAPTIPDCDPADFTFKVLTNDVYGARLPGWAASPFSKWSDYCIASGLLLSPALTEQQAASEFLANMAKLTNTAPVWEVDHLEMIPYGDQPVTGNGRTYTPNVTPVYDLTLDHFIAKAGDPGVKVVRKLPSSRYNHVRIQFRNRANYYNEEIVEAKDDADIAANGLRSMDIIKADWIVDSAVARTVAQLIMQRSCGVQAHYEFKLPWAFDMLSLMELVTLTEPSQGLVKTVVRIIQIDEDENRRLTFTAEDFPEGVATAALYPAEQAGGYQHDYNASPGSVDSPAFFEAPVERTETGLEVYVAVKGSGAQWGGCNVWVSMDGTNYKRVTTVYGSARYGTLTGPISGDSMPVSTSGQLLSGTAADAAALNTLCYAGGEYLAYTTATLTSPGAYTLSGLVRGAFGSPQSAHANNDPFVRVDEQIAKSGPLDLSFIGKTIYFKFTSFNVFQAAEQSLADVQAYSYQITGAMVSIPPSQPGAGTAELEPYGVRLRIPRNPEPDVVAYEWYIGSTFAAAEAMELNGGTSYTWPVQVAGTRTAWVVARDALGIKSLPRSIAITVQGPATAGIVATIVGSDLQLEYTATSGSFAIAGYEIRHGTSFASATVVGFFLVTKHTRRIDWAGARTWWVVPVDVKGNYGTPGSILVNVVAPGPVTSARAEVVDNNVLLYWSPPVGSPASLPVERYEVRRGASWAAGTPLGSNGNSTFTTYFEQQSGAYTYWVTAYDSANNAGAPVGIPATVNQPPDYVLRTNINSTFSGTLTNMVLENGRLYGPAAPETLAQHFSSRSWLTPQDQVNAGYPIYLNPSASSGSYEETFDYGTVLPATVITETLGYSALSGIVNVSCQIYTKAAAGDPWTAATAGATSVLASGFRYVRVVWTFTCTAGANLIEITSFNHKLSNKLKTDSGVGTANAADTGGTTVTFSVPFIDVDGIVVTAGGTAPVVAVYDFADVPNPTSFKVLLFDRATGNRVSGPFSWSARGY